MLHPEEWGPELAKIPGGLGSRGAVVLLVAFQKPIDTSLVVGVKSFAPGAHPLLSKIVHDSAKPERASSSGGYDLWVVHSTPEYAHSHLVGEQLDDPEAVQEEMLDAFLETVGVSFGTPQVAHKSVMAWDHAQPEEDKRLGSTHLLESTRRVGLCGDFFCGGRAEGVEAAALSGLSLAESLAALISRRALDPDLG